MKRPLAVLALLAMLAVTHEALAYALDRAELIERLLAPGPDALIALPAAMLLHVLRLALVFLGPGVAVLALASLTTRGSRAQRASERPTAQRSDRAP